MKALTVVLFDTFNFGTLRIPPYQRHQDPSRVMFNEFTLVNQYSGEYLPTPTVSMS